jgi:hypothetical protein
VVEDHDVASRGRNESVSGALPGSRNFISDNRLDDFAFLSVYVDAGKISFRHEIDILWSARQSANANPLTHEQALHRTSEDSVVIRPDFLHRIKVRNLRGHDVELLAIMLSNGEYRIGLKVFRRISAVQSSD